MAGTGLLSEQMMDAFAAKRPIDADEATRTTHLLTKGASTAHEADVHAGSATPQTPPRSPTIRKTATGGMSPAELRNSPARIISVAFDNHAVTTWEMASRLTDPNEALLVDVRDSVLVFLPQFTEAVVMLQHFLDLYYGYQKPTGHNPATQIPEIEKKEMECRDPKIWIRRRKILAFFVKWLKSEYGRQDIVAKKEARTLLNNFCKIESERPDAKTVVKVLLKQLQDLVGVGGATRSLTEPTLRAPSVSTLAGKLHAHSVDLTHRAPRSVSSPLAVGADEKAKKKSWFKRKFSKHKSRRGSDVKQQHMRGRTTSIDDIRKRSPAPTKVKEVTQIQALSVAHELTAKDYEMTKCIQYRELTDMQWKSKKKLELAPNVVKVIEEYNLRTHWVVSMMFHNEKLKKNPIVFFLDLAKHLLDLRNFNCLSQIVAGLDHELASPTRLPEIWNALSKPQKDRYESLKTLLSPSNSYCQYRKMLKELRDKKVRVIPMFNVFLNDLYFIQDRLPWIYGAASTKAPPNTVNTSKLFQLYDIIHTNLSDCRSDQFSVFDSYDTVRASLDESMKTVTMDFGDIAKMARDNKTKVKRHANKLLSALGDTGLL